MRTKLSLITFFLIAAFSFGAAAQPNQNKGWQEKVKSERIAFLTSEMDLTPAEAAKFWALYNEAEGERMKAFGEVMDAFGKLEKAIQDKASEQEIEKALQNYLKAEKASGEVDVKYLERYRKVIPVDNVAKLIIGEEKFRRQQIARLRGGQHKGFKKDN